MLHISISQGDGKPIYAQLIQQLKTMIATGRLDPDEELPSVRALAQQLVVNPNTVVRAYRELETEGLVYKKRGSGTFVSAEVTPFTEEVRRRILIERTDALVVEALNMGHDKDEVRALLEERWEELQGGDNSDNEGETS